VQRSKGHRHLTLFTHISQWGTVDNRLKQKIVDYLNPVTVQEHQYMQVFIVFIDVWFLYCCWTI